MDKNITASMEQELSGNEKLLPCFSGTSLTAPFLRFLEETLVVRFVRKRIIYDSVYIACLSMVFPENAKVVS